MNTKKVVATVATFLIAPRIVKAVAPVTVDPPKMSTAEQQASAARVSGMATDIRAGFVGLLATTGVWIFWDKISGSKK
ncbi:MAG: hypothetical protein QG602_411 [Verrucomicrobiota bacterium]|nr:hypothetical protein [Verrucomicrobiota bacterium]